MDGAANTTQTDGVLQVPPPELSLDAVTQLLHERWGVEVGALRVLASERDLNVLVDDAYVLKVSNPAEPDAVVEMEVAAMAHAATIDGLRLPETIPSVEGPIAVVTDGRGRRCLARVITVVAGAPLEGHPITRETAAQVGRTCALVQRALAGFFHPAAARELDWDPRRVDGVWRASGSPAEWQQLVERLRVSLADVGRLPGGVQHADVTLTNVLADDGGVTGVIDFGDMHHTASVTDLAITLASVLRNTAEQQPADTWELTRSVIDGYQRERMLDACEVEVLGELVLARLLLTVLISLQRADVEGADRAYVSQYDRATPRALDALLAVDQGELAARLHRAAGTSRVAAGAHDTSDLDARRAAIMGGSASPLFYRRHLEVVRGEGPWLHTADGRRYLDAYNNVAVVGHAHPTVVGAVSRQLTRVNTNSRYLHEGVVELAERIVATLAPALDTCLFSASGTEANELAWRLAVENTGGDAAIIVQHAYHGSSHWMSDLSSNEWPEGHVPRAVATIEAPHGDPSLLTEGVGAARVAAAAEELRARGLRPAMVIVDLGFTSEGVLDAPAPFLRGLVAGAHEAGALFVADEVQSGYGRTGEFWRHTRAGIEPDIVTMGKPMGAGYPMGGTVARREIVDRLGARYEYFSTFAATPAASAAGNAVLDVIEDERLVTRAARTGEYLREGLRRLAEASDVLGEVRGRGLIAGVDLFDGASDARARSRELLESLVQAGVLSGLTGPRGTVLKVRPPLVWDEAHVDLFLTRLSGVLEV